MKTQLTIQQLEQILIAAKNNKKYDSSLSDTVEITVIKQTDCHAGGDTIRAELLSSYSECMGTIVYNDLLK